MTAKRIISIALLLILNVVPAWARQDAALPDLAPRQVEITGDLTISFPTLRRQPIAGFNPPPRVPDIPADRQPFAEAYAQRSADLPPSPLSPPEPPEISGMERRKTAKGLFEARIGAYLDRRLATDVSLIGTEKTTALLNFDYAGTDGQAVDVSGTRATTGRDAFSGTIDLEHRMDALSVGLENTGYRSSYGLFGAIPAAGTVARVNPPRRVEGVESTISLSSPLGSKHRFRFATTAGINRVDTELYDPAVRRDPATEREAGYLRAELDAAYPILGGQIKVHANGSTTGLDATGFPGNTVRTGLLLSEFAWRQASRLSVSAGAALVGFDSQTQTGTDPARRRSYLSPIVHAAYLVADGVTAEAAVRPLMTSDSPRELMVDVPVLMDEPVMLPTIATLDARLGLFLESDIGTARWSGGWRDQPFRRIAQEPAIALRGYTAGYPTLSYRSSEVLFSTLNLSFMPMKGLRVGLDALWQRTTIAATGNPVPYVSPFVHGGFVSLSVLDGDLETMLSYRYESGRTADMDGTVDLPSIFSMSATFSWFFHSHYGIITGVRDLGPSSEYWRNYTYESSAFFLGLRYRW